MNTQKVKRKLTAILSADVEGYSRLMGEDEVRTIQTLKRYKEVISKFVQNYRGRVVDAPGDNLLAEFVSVVDAVQCAVEIQREIAECNEESSQECKMYFRIGVNLGDVVEEEERIYGDGVNIAARMESLCEGGGVCISGTAFEHVENKLDLEFEDLGEHAVKNITKPVRVYRVLSYPGAAAQRVIKDKKTIVKKWSKMAVAAVSAFVVVGAVAVWYFYFRLPMEVPSAEKTAFPLPDKPSIAVLPFKNLSDDPKQEYFADGLTEDLITNLSLYRELFVISRNSSFTYKGKAVDVKQVGRELGVAFVVEGSVRRENDQVRVNTQLIDARTGSHVWADRFDRELTGIFAVQDEITRAISGRLAPEVAKARVEGAKDKPTDNLDAWDLYLRARDAQSDYTRDMQAEAIRLGGLSIARDPGFAAPYGLIALAKGTQFFYQWADDPERTMAEAIERAQSAIRLDGNDPAGYAALGYVYRLTGDQTRSISNLERAAELNPNDANICLISFTLFSIAVAYIQKGDLALAVEYGEQSVEKASTPADRVYSQSFLAWALCRAGELNKGIDLLIQVVSVFQDVRLLPAEIMVRIFLGEAYWLAGEFEKSKQTLKGVLNLAERLNMKPWIGFAHRILGEIAVKATPDKAVAHFDKSLSIYTMIGAENDLALTYEGYGRLHRQKGSIAEAREYFEKALGIFERLGALTEPDKVRKDLADLSED